MIGDLFRLKAFTAYQPKKPKGERGLISEGIKTQPGYHTVMMALGFVRDGEPLTDEWIDGQLRKLQLQRIDRTQKMTP